MKNLLFLCLAAGLISTAGCRGGVNQHSYLAGPPCGPGEQCASGCSDCNAGACDQCGGYGLSQCSACRGDGCQACAGRGGFGCQACGGAGILHGERCAQRRMARQDAAAFRNAPASPGPLSASVTYPYYTNRGPRDFFADDPRSIGP